MTRIGVLHSSRLMTLDTTLQLWDLLLWLIPTFFIGLFTAFTMWREQKDHKKQIQTLSDDQEEIRLLIERKNEKTLEKLEKIELAFSITKESLVEIKTLLKVLLEEKITRNHGKN